MSKIYIARHGQNEDNANFILNGHRDLPLTELGRRQARELATGIQKAGLTFDKVYSSPLCRAFETAEIVCKELGLLPPQKEPDLIERHFGVMTGRSIHDIEKLVPPAHILKTETVTYFIEAPEAEDYPTAVARAQRFLDQMNDVHPQGSVLCVAHSDIGKLLYGGYYGISWRDMLSRFHFGNCELLVLEPGGTPQDHVIRIEQHNH